MTINKDLADVLGNFVQPHHQILRCPLRRPECRATATMARRRQALIAELDRRIAPVYRAARGCGFPQGDGRICAPSGWQAMNS